MRAFNVSANTGKPSLKIPQVITLFKDAEAGTFINTHGQNSRDCKGAAEIEEQVTKLETGSTTGTKTGPTESGTATPHIAELRRVTALKNHDVSVQKATYKGDEQNGPGSHRTDRICMENCRFLWKAQLMSGPNPFMVAPYTHLSLGSGAASYGNLSMH